MPPKRKHDDDESTDEDYEEVESINSDSSGESVHTSDEEEDEKVEDKDISAVASGDEIDPKEPAAPKKTVYYRYISSDPIDKGSEKYKPVRVGPLHIGTPEATDPLPDHHKHYSVLKTPDGEYVSALRYRKDPAATIEEYYFISNQTTWQAQTRRLLKNCKMGMTVLANLSLYVHNMTDGLDCDKSLLESEDLANYCDDHLLDTQHAKKIIAKAAKAAAAKAEKKKQAAAAKEEASKKRKAEDNDDATPSADATTAQPPKKKRPPKKKAAVTPAIVEESPDSPSKTGTTPEKAPAIQAKPKISSAGKVTKSRQLQLGDQLKKVASASPRKMSKSPAGKSSAKKKIVLTTDVPAFQSVVPKLQSLLDELGVKAVVMHAST